MEPGLDLMDVKEQSGTSSINIASGFRQLNVKTEPGKEQFPAGMRVLVVDDDPMCLMILEKMLRRCSYHVTACAKATTALAMLRENKSNFDLVISDVYMPDMDGFKLLELVGLEMDLPVIMMSTDGETSAVMKGITHGACDYLLKPVRMEELRNIWQHVVRKRQNEASATLQCDRSGSPEENERHKRSFDEGEHTSSLNSKKRKEGKDEDDDENEHEDPLTLKKPRVVWSVELHQQFVTAVNQLGIDKAVPKRILELMNVQGLTRENVASHLQKYRLYLKRLSVQHSQNGTNMAFNTTSESSYGAMNSLDLMNDLTPLSPNVQLPFATMNSGMTGRLDLAGTIASNAVDSPVFLQYGAVQTRPIARPHIASQLINNNQGLGTSVSFLPGMSTEILPQNKQLPPRQSIEDASVTDSIQLHPPQVGRALNPSPSREINSAASETDGDPLMLLHQQNIQCNRQQNRPADEASPSAGPTACFNGYSDLATSAQFVPSSLGRKVPILSNASSGAASLVRETDNHFFSVVGSNFTALNGSGVPPVIVSSEGRSDIFGASIANRNNSLSDKSCFNSAGKSTSGVLLVSNQGGRMGWQTNDLGKVSIAGFIPRYNKVSSGAEVYNPMSGSGHASGHELLDQGPNFQRKFNGSLFQTLENVQCNSEQSTGERDFRVKPEPILDSLGSGVRNTFEVQKVASSDDLFSIFFRQQQKEPMLAENDLR